MAAQLDRPMVSKESNTSQWRWWSAITNVLLLLLFSQAVLAGAMLSGIDWARRAHSTTALVLVASTVTAGLVATITLRRIRHGLKLGLTLLSLAAVIFLQAAVGVLSARGVNLMWVHVPLGVALIGFAAHATASARRLGGVEI